jgi:cell division initiation protein
MKLTPLDIHHKEFRHGLRGYNVEEVDAFLDEVADEFERLFKENIDLSEKNEAAQQAVRQYQEQEQTIRNTMISAQTSAEEIVKKSQDEATAVLRDAEMKAKEIIHNALTQKQQVQNELIRIKQAEEEFRSTFKTLLDQHNQALSEVRLPEDVNVLMGDTGEGVFGEVEVTHETPVELAAEPPVEPEPVQPSIAPEPEPQPELASDPAVVAEEMPAEPPESGFVTSVTLGETEAPDVDQGVPNLGEPKEFTIGSFDDLADRDGDIDIEEID